MNAALKLPPAKPRFFHNSRHVDVLRLVFNRNEKLSLVLLVSLDKQAAKTTYPADGARLVSSV